MLAYSKFYSFYYIFNRILRFWNNLNPSRDFQFKVKGISMSVFTEDDVAFLASMGNELFNSKYLARLNSKDFTLPNGNDIVKLKDFIKQKYIDKKWCEDDGSSSSRHTLDRQNSGLVTGTGPITIKPLLSKQTSVCYLLLYILNKQQSMFANNQNCKCNDFRMLGIGGLPLAAFIPVLLQRSRLVVLA